MNEGITPGTPGASSAPPARVAFSGENGEFRRLVTRGALLELVTFGFYRFWLATNIRRHLWSNTSVEGDALEYTGTARELLIGFLFALAILVPIYLVYFVIGIEAERWQAFASVPLGLFFYGFALFAVYRARRYRLTRTLWHGVRFWMTGSGLAYALRALGWTFLTVLTLGLVYPWRAAALEGYKMGHTFYGDLPGRFGGKGWDFFKRGWWLWLVALSLVAGLSGGVALSKKIAAPPAVGIVALVFVLVGVFAVPFIYAAFKATEWRWWVQGLRFGHGPGGMRFDSDLRRGALTGNIWKMIGVSLAVFAIVPLVGFINHGVMMALGIDTFKIVAGHKLPTIAFVIPMAVAYLATFLALGVVWRIYMVQRIWKLVVSSISIENLDAADHVVAKGEAASAIGEGLADSLDVAGF
ncbi:MAG TPA: DUF898 family protein [Methylocella sp.]|nr:DUF898 family protein [Methylocella sp.]